MQRLTKIYRTFSLIEIVLGIIGIGILIYYKPWDTEIFTIIFILFILSIIPTIFCNKLINATRNGIKLKEEFRIVGHIANAVKLLIVLLVLFGGIYFFTLTVNLINSVNTYSIIFFISIFSIIIWALISFFDFYAYILIAKMNREFRFSDIENMGMGKSSL